MNQIIRHQQFNVKKGVMTAFAFALMTFSAVSQVSARGAPESFADLAEAMLPTVVNISTVQAVRADDQRAVPDLPPGSPFEEWFEQFRGPRSDEEQRPRMSAGSGFFISEDGYIVTNNHVIGDAAEISVTTTNGDEYVAELVGRDASLDIALIKVDGSGFKAAAFGDSNTVRVGEWVMSIGNPFGLGGSVTAGIVSARHRDIQAGPYDDFIQTDASINRGNSGGPLFNMDGRVIGVNTMIFTPNGGNIGIGFSIPAADVQRTLAQLLEFGKPRRGWIGVSIQQVTEEHADSIGFEGTEGSIIGSVQDDSPAKRAGLQPYDIIVEFNGQKVEENRDLPRIVAHTGVGETVPVRIWRNGEYMTLSLTTGELQLPEDTPVADAEATVAPASSIVMGMKVQALDDDLRETYEIPEDVDGLVITDVEARSVAAERGLRPGDVIAQTNQQDTLELTHFESVLKSARDAGRKNVLLRIYRGGSYILLPMPISAEQ